MTFSGVPPGSLIRTGSTPNGPTPSTSVGGSGILFARQTAEIGLLTDPEKLRARLDQPFDVEQLTAGLSNETFVATHP